MSEPRDADRVRDAVAELTAREVSLTRQRCCAANWGTAATARCSASHRRSSPRACRSLRPRWPAGSLEPLPGFPLRFDLPVRAG